MIRRFTWDIVYHESLDSTNSLMYDQVSGDPSIKEGFVIQTGYQTSGRGQIGNTWESKPDKNLICSILLRPEIEVDHQFMISKIACLALVELLNDLDIDDLRIKWPNDIYVGDKKIAGILIQNMLQGKKIKSCIIGIGLNVNQEDFESDAPNPTSVKLLLKEEHSLEQILLSLLDKLAGMCGKLQLKKNIEIDHLYKFLLYRRNQQSEFLDINGIPFMGMIKDVSTSGHLQIVTDQGLKQFAFREIKYVL